jgi:enamine deaminase RidA (YjgF/YER057c/UK114 family)
MTKWSKRITELGIELPEVAKPIAAYVPAVKAGRVVYTSGQLPMVNGELMFVGQVGVGISLEDGAACAKQCALNALAAIGSVVDLNKIDFSFIKCFYNAIKSIEKLEITALAF